jgi:hypothetical protein
MTKVIDFESVRKKKVEEKIDNVVDTFEEREKQRDILVVELAHEIVDYIAEYGYNVESAPESITDIFMIMECLNSLLHRVEGLPYPMHELSSGIVKLSDDEDLNHRHEELMRFFLHGIEPEGVDS